MVTRLGGLGEQPLDLVVIGGGITGCGIAREARLRGLSVALFEKGDFAGGTSSRSSRLIHGGVRYLEHGQLRLVFEASAERRRLLELVPHLVHPLEFTWPVYRGGRIPRWKLGAGLTLYDLLALFRNVGRHHRLSRDATLAIQPALEREGLVGGATYFDARTDDTRLTLSVAMDARRRGAMMLNHVRVTGLITEGKRIRGVEVRDELTGETRTVRAGVVINAAGPWSDDVRGLEGAIGGPKVRGSKGVHITVDQTRVGNHDALTLLSPDDGRVMFALPSGTQTIIGTTDTFTGVSPDDVRATQADVDYLLDATNHFFPAARLGRGDVIAAWAGIRPLAAGGGAGDSVSASREHSIAVTPGGVVTITGGKLTTFRIMAEQTVDAALRQLGRSAPSSHSADTPIDWSAGDPADVIETVTRETGDASLAQRLVSTYGNRWNVVLATLRSAPRGLDRLIASEEVRMGELYYACEAEAAATLGDLLVRRTHLAFRTRDNARSVAATAARYVAPLLAWSDDRVDDEVRRYDAEASRIFTIDPAPAS